MIKIANTLKDMVMDGRCKMLLERGRVLQALLCRPKVEFLSESLQPLDLPILDR